ncbi:SHOCT domain-containing protein [Halalkalicoccus ordinarius]|uniref:SHOCT domain-containing protein n=1 Tax=Halalkalicoccus ordinarius TaxID=3116651 RepID=UPI00300ECE8F
MSVVFSVVLLTLSGISLLWIIVQNVSILRIERIATLVERVEQTYPPFRILGLSDFLSPPKPSADEQAEQALADLKQQYVDGEITEAEFERKVDRLVASESIDEVRAAHERKQVKDDTASSNRM